jgi:hypothetical protein
MDGVQYTHLVVLDAATVGATIKGLFVFRLPLQVQRRSVKHHGSAH